MTLRAWFVRLTRPTTIPVRTRASVELLAHPGHLLDDRLDARDVEPVRLDRQYRLAAAGQGGAGQIAERRRAVDEDEVPGSRESLQGADRTERKIDLQGSLSGHQPGRRRHQIDTKGPRRLGQVGEAAGTQERLEEIAPIVRPRSQPR